MEATELMVGDWLYAIDEDGNKHLCRANSIQVDYLNKTNDFCVDFFGTDFEPEFPDIMFEAQPIPLTDEILEKNGFTFNGTKDWVFEQRQYYQQKAFTIRVTPPQPNNEFWDKESTGFEVWDANSDIIMEGLSSVFVHQLQHVLKLCGIEKEIIL